VTAGETHQAIEATFRIERARLIAGLARIVRNVDRAEELAQDALVVALSEWPRTGVPANPGVVRDCQKRSALRTALTVPLTACSIGEDEPARRLALTSTVCPGDTWIRRASAA
jgi:hypothetical protein